MRAGPHRRLASSSLAPETTGRFPCALSFVTQFLLPGRALAAARLSRVENHLDGFVGGTRWHHTLDLSAAEGLAGPQFLSSALMSRLRMRR